MEDLRLGSLATQATTQDPAVLALLSKGQLVFTTAYDRARTIAATRIRTDISPYKVLTGAEILGKFLSKERLGTDVLEEGYPDVKHLYLMFGYVEAPNRYLPNLIVQLMGQRFHQGLHCWLFFPHPTDVMINQWGDAFSQLNYLPHISINRLTDLEAAPTAGPIAPKPTPKPEARPGSYETRDDNAFREPGNDPKFRRKRR